jgi:hypothetical protein
LRQWQSREESTVSKATILANLHLHAVLPRLQDLVRLDDKARSIASQMNLSVRFRVLNGPSVVIDIRNGVVSSSGDPKAGAQLGLLFASCDQLNNMFMEKPAVPIPYKRLHKLAQMNNFTRLTKILTRYLRPSRSDLDDPDFKKKHVEMAFLTGLAGSAQIAKHDPKMEHTVRLLPHGSLQFSILPDGPFAWAVVDQDKNITSGPGKIDNPTADLEINGINVALDLLADRLDLFAAVGKGDIRASGLLPLGDELNALLDRVGKFLA